MLAASQFRDGKEIEWLNGVIAAKKLEDLLPQNEDARERFHAVQCRLSEAIDAQTGLPRRVMLKLSNENQRAYDKEATTYCFLFDFPRFVLLSGWKVPSSLAVGFFQYV